MDGSTKLPACQCTHFAVAEPASGAGLGVAKTARSLPSMLLSVLIAFFPKCPLCWAVYMSMFSGIGLARLPYMRWLLPVLLALLGIHLVMLFRQSARRGYGPFLLSLAGSILILSGRAYLPAEKWVLLTGMILIGIGSLTSSFLNTRNPVSIRAKNHL